MRNTVTTAEGIFVLSSLNPDTYNLTIKATGFKMYEQNNIDITANAPRDLGRIALALGAMTEEISVTAVATPVQTGSSENSNLVDETEATQIAPERPRHVGHHATIPGVNLGNTYLTGGDATSETVGLGALTSMVTATTARISPWMA